MNRTINKWSFTGITEKSCNKRNKVIITPEFVVIALFYVNMIYVEYLV